MHALLCILTHCFARSLCTLLLHALLCKLFVHGSSADMDLGGCRGGTVGGCCPTDPPPAVPVQQLNAIIAASASVKSSQKLKQMLEVCMGGVGDGGGLSAS